ncbi:hypothetical protein [Streptomyces rubiginosohelvolus]|uniref:hypothetical protein n=1 Tax=Streptomyces rubiginosohelvolus TaxID=67362 RepID=UPI00378F3AF6
MKHGRSVASRRLNGAEAIVIIVVVGLTAALVVAGKVPVLDVLLLLAGAGLVAGCTIALSTRFSFGAVKTVLKAALTAA